jgi:monoterpene epsilon-lactone hydrolase
MHVVAAYMKRTSHATLSSAERTIAAMNKPADPPNPPHEQFQVNHITLEQVAGFPVYSVVPATDEPRDTPRDIVVYLHGGAYFREITKYHWGLISDLAATGLKVIVPIYGLAPTYEATAAYDLLRQVWISAWDEARTSGHTVSIAGDSAGGGLALGSVLRFLSIGSNGSNDSNETPAPTRMALIAPWLDLTCSLPEMDDLIAKDPWLHPTGLRIVGKEWAREVTQTKGEQDVLIDPLAAPQELLNQLPPTRVWSGTRDILHPDSTNFAQSSGCEMTVVSGALHAYPLIPAPEGKTARREVATWLAGGGRYDG